MRPKPFISRLYIKRVSTICPPCGDCFLPPRSGPRIHRKRSAHLIFFQLHLHLLCNSTWCGINHWCPSGAFWTSCFCFSYCAWQAAVLLQQKGVIPSSSLKFFPNTRLTCGFAGQKARQLYKWRAGGCMVNLHKVFEAFAEKLYKTLLYKLFIFLTAVLDNINSFVFITTGRTGGLHKPL